MVSFHDLGLVNTKEMYRKAIEGGYACPGYNFNNMEQLQAIITACVETRSPVVLQVSEGARKYANQTLLRYMAHTTKTSKFPSKSLHMPTTKT
jgi:fructose-bisphosphate aldolase class II